MAVTYLEIAKITVGSGGASTLDFTSIPQTYTDLKLVLSARSTGTNGVCYVYFNNDTTNANYNVLRLYGAGYFAASQGFSAPYFAYTNTSGTTTNTFENGEIYIPNYTSSNQKSISSDMAEENVSTGGQIFLSCGKWSGTSAINRITIQQVIDSGFVENSTAYLYGIKNS